MAEDDEKVFLRKVRRWLHARACARVQGPGACVAGAAGLPGMARRGHRILLEEGPTWVLNQNAEDLVLHAWRTAPLSF